MFEAIPALIQNAIDAVQHYDYVALISGTDYPLRTTGLSDRNHFYLVFSMV